MDIRQNQTSFDFENTYKVEHSKTHKEYKWKPKLHRYEAHDLYGKVPNLTYFLRVIWSATHLVEQISLISIPNGQFFDTHNTILAGVKSYPPRGDVLEHLRFDIKKLTELDGWRERILYKRKD